MSIAILQNYDDVNPPEYTNIHVNRLKTRLGLQLGSNLPVLVAIPPETAVVQTNIFSNFLQMTSNITFPANVLEAADSPSTITYTRIGKIVTINFRKTNPGELGWTLVNGAFPSAETRQLLFAGVNGLGNIGVQILADLGVQAVNKQRYLICVIESGGVRLPAEVFLEYGALVANQRFLITKLNAAGVPVAIALNDVLFNFQISYTLD